MPRPQNEETITVMAYTPEQTDDLVVCELPLSQLRAIMMPGNAVGISEAATLLDLSPAGVHKRQREGRIAEPIVQGGLRGPLWLRGQLDESATKDYQADYWRRRKDHDDRTST